MGGGGLVALQILITYFKATRTFLFYLRTCLLVINIRNYELTYVTNFYIRMIFITYMRGIHPLVNTLLFTLKLEFCPNSLRMTPESQRP